MNKILWVFLLVSYSTASLALLESEVRCLRGTPPSYYDQLKIDEITFQLHWVGNQMQGEYRGTMELKGGSFLNSDETISVVGHPHYDEFNVGGEGQVRYWISTCTDAVQKSVGTSCIGEINLKNAEGWTKTTKLICTRTR
jgi:hypothetical protein